MSGLIDGYSLQTGSGLDRALLVKFMQKTYQELYPGCNFAHLAQTVEQYLSNETPLWWVEQRQGDGQSEEQSESKSIQPVHILKPNPRHPIACLWLGSAIDQVWGDRHAYIFLLYVDPEHRRHGIGSALMRHAESWAKARGDQRIGLQVFCQNQPALNLYEHLGYQPQSIWMTKRL